MSYLDYEAVRLFSDDTRITKEFGNGLVWRDFEKELEHSVKIRNRWYDIQSWFITFCNFMIFILFFVISMIAMHYLHDRWISTALGFIPYFMLAIYTKYYDRLDDMSYLVLPIAMISPFGWAYIGLVLSLPLK